MDQLPNIGDAVESIRRRELSPVELLEHCLSRIERFEDRIHAWVLVDETGARREAERLTQLAARGEIVGPLHGIPIGIKDIIDVAGMPTRCGSPLRKDIAPAEKDAMIVANLRRAGAIILGKTVTTEWACFDPPPTRNPWNLDRTSGGSSSGSAAAVATEMCEAAIGTQTGGSTIRPAAYCGIAGLKPTFAPEMMVGIAPVSFHLDHVGPLARSAADLQVMYAAMAGHDASRELPDVPPSWAVLEEYFFEQASEDVRAVVEAALRKLTDASVRPTPPLPKSFAALHDHHLRIMAVDVANLHREAFRANPEQFGPAVGSLIESGLSTPPSDYAESLHHQQQFKSEMVQFIPTMNKGSCRSGDPHHLVMPATTTTAPGLETTGDPRLNSPWSYCGLPTITIPSGLAEDGLPVGLQLVGPYHTELELLAAAAWCEARIGITGPSLPASTR